MHPLVHLAIHDRDRGVADYGLAAQRRPSELARGHPQHPILNEQAFFTLMITAFLLNIAVPVTIGWWLPYYERSRSA